MPKHTGHLDFTHVLCKEVFSLRGQITATWSFKDPGFLHIAAPPSPPHLLLQSHPGWRTLLFLPYLIPCWEIVSGSFARRLHESDHCSPRKGKQTLMIKSHFCQRLKDRHYLIYMSTSIWIKGVIFLWCVDCTSNQFSSFSIILGPLNLT